MREGEIEEEMQIQEASSISVTLIRQSSHLRLPLAWSHFVDDHFPRLKYPAVSGSELTEKPHNTSGERRQLCM